MVEATEKFLVDSNSFMTPFRFYYAFDLIPLIGKSYRILSYQNIWSC